MKQKLLTLMTLLLCAVSGAWAADFSSPATKTYGTQKFLDVAGTDANVTVSTNNYLTYGAYYIGVYLKVTDWYNASDGNPSGNKENGVVGDFSEQGFIKVTSTSQDNTNGNAGLKVNSSRTRYYFITGATSVAGLVKDNGSTKYVQLQIQEVAENGDLGEAITINGDKTTSQYVINGGALDPSKYYKITFTSNSTSNSVLYQIRFGKTPSKTIATQAFAGVKKGSTELTQGTDYTVSSTTITLAEAYKSVSAPTDVKLINHITYTDETDAYQDVEVTLVKNGDYFEGSVSIGLTEYTVKVPVNATPTLTADKDAVTVTSTKAAASTSTIHITGANLTGVASVAFASAVDGLSISPETITLTDGAVDQDFTVTYHSMAAVASTKVNLTFTVGAKSVVIPVTYSSTAADVTTITDVTAATTWDWKDTSKDVNSPANGFEIPVANASDLTGFPTGFDYEALAANAQYFARKSEKCFQGITLKFHTTKAGHITVVFSNTGGNRPYRHLFVNGVDTGKKSNTSNANDVTAENIYVEAGDVELKGMMEDGDNNPTTPNMLRIYKVVFVPSDPAPSVNISDKEWATYVTETAIDFTSQTNVEAFIVTGHEGTAITKTKVTSVPANTPVLLHALNGGGSYYSFDTRATSSTDVSANMLKAGTGAAVAAESGKTKYVLSVNGGKAAFKKINATAATVPVGKAYLQFDEVIEAPLFDLDGEATSIKAVEAKAVENGEYYNLAGQRVAQPTKGLYIVNGKKVIIK